MEFTEQLVVGAGLLEWVSGLISEFRVVAIAGLGVVGFVVATMIIAKNPSVGRSITGVAVGGFIAALPWLIPAFGEMVRGEVEGSPARSERIVLEDEPPYSVEA